MRGQVAVVGAVVKECVVVAAPKAPAPRAGGGGTGRGRVAARGFRVAVAGARLGRRYRGASFDGWLPNTISFTETFFFFQLMAFMKMMMFLKTLKKMVCCIHARF